MKSFIPLLGIIMMAASSCGDSSLTRTLPNITGASGEVLVVMNKTLWEGKGGEAAREDLAAILVGMPQPEPAFDLLHVNPEGFKDVYQAHRNILIAEIIPGTDEADLTVTENRWAESQIVLRLTAPDTTELVNALHRYAPVIRERIDNAERERLTLWLAKSAGKEKAEVSSGDKKLEILMPAGYKPDFSREGLLMISAETPATTQSVIVSYSDPMIATIGCIELADLTEKITSVEVKGPDGGSFMVIEKKVPVSCRSFKRNNTEYIEMRGLWTLEGGYMGGPFISYAYVDPEALKIVVVIGFVYAPKNEKRELLRQVEALMYSVRKVS